MAIMFQIVGVLSISNIVMADERKEREIKSNLIESLWRRVNGVVPPPSRYQTHCYLLPFIVIIEMIFFCCCSFRFV